MLCMDSANGQWQVMAAVVAAAKNCTLCCEILQGLAGENYNLTAATKAY